MNKTKMSITIKSNLAQVIEEISKAFKKSKSAILEEAFESWMQQKMIEDAKCTAKITFEDLPTEDEWIELQPKW